MKVLSDDKIDEVFDADRPDTAPMPWFFGFARDIEAAVLAELPMQELPESHELVDMDGETNHVYYEIDVRQAFIQGVALGWQDPDTRKEPT